MKTILLFLTLLFVLPIFSQSTISGKVVDEKNQPIIGANIFIEGAYDGTSSDENGDFSFETAAQNNQTLVVSFLIYETLKMTIAVSDFKNQTIKLRESMNSLHTVEVSAGTFQSGDKARVSVLKPLDIVTTAGSVGNIIAALQTLPGSQVVGEDGRLYVRGGQADETQTYVDGIRVAQPYGATTENIPARGRFSPFLFSGISFSTGGYSAEFGEALSSVLLLYTQDEPDQNKTDISIMSVGVGLGHTQKWEKSSLSLNTSYMNLTPYQAVIPQNLDWNKPAQSLSGEAVYRYHFNNGIFKLYVAFDSEEFDINQPNINNPLKDRVNLTNANFYLNSSYKGVIFKNWQMFTGFSYGIGNNKTGINADQLDNQENALFLKYKMSKNLSDDFKLSFGTDFNSTKYDENYFENLGENFNSGYVSNIGAVYAEGEMLFSRKFAAKAGLRLTNSSLLTDPYVSPRISLAYKVAKYSQFSFAYGEFSQTPNTNYLKYSQYHQFDAEKASHYILNFQYNKEGRTFRAEAYYKDYSNLIKYNTLIPNYNSVYTNDGSGFAKGLDIFWRDGKSIKNLEYWISYSYIDSERNYKNYPTQVTPNFVANNNLSIVTKYWISDWKSQIGFTNTFATGRPYNNPNDAQFMNGRTGSYNVLSFNWAYLLSPQKILYLSVSNVLDAQNVYGYKYADNPNIAGIYNRQAIAPTADQFFFVGFFWTISANKNDNQLKNL